jgi:hypothetical protein
MFTFRARKYRTKPINECDFQPVYQVDPADVCPGGTTIGCEDNKRKHQPEITTLDMSKYVEVSAVTCGAEDGGESRYRIQVEWKGNRPNFNQLDCECGAEVLLYIYDENGDYDRQQVGVIDDVLPHNISPTPVMWVKTTTLAANECIKGIDCNDDDATANVDMYWESADRPDCDAFAGLLFHVDVPLECETGDNVTISLYNSSGVLIDDAITGTIADGNPQNRLYQITSVDGDYNKAYFDAAASVTIECA